MITVLGGGPIAEANPDAQALAAQQLRAVGGRVKSLLAKADVKLDDATLAHLVDLDGRIQKVLDARLEMPRP
jgi:hypothetical protein